MIWCVSVCLLSAFGSLESLSVHHQAAKVCNKADAYQGLRPLQASQIGECWEYLYATPCPVLELCRVIGLSLGICPGRANR